MKPAVAALAFFLAACHYDPPIDNKLDDKRGEAVARESAEAAFARYRRPDLIIGALVLHGGERVADVGAGDGFLSVPLAEAVGKTGLVVATDVDEQALGRLRARALAATGARIETRHVSGDDQGLGDDHFDVILLSEVDQLLADRAGFLARLRPHLKEGGRLVVCNRRGDRLALMAAATAAGLTRVSEFSGLPAHFLITFGVTK